MLGQRNLDFRSAKEFSLAQLFCRLHSVGQPGGLNGQREQCYWGLSNIAVTSFGEEMALKASAPVTIKASSSRKSCNVKWLLGSNISMNPHLVALPNINAFIKLLFDRRQSALVPLCEDYAEHEDEET